MPASRRWLWTLALAASVGPAARADILALKDGSVVECRIVNSAVVKNNKQYLRIEDEKKAQREIPVEDVAAIYPGKPSWEIRAENLAWYEKEKTKERDKWGKEFSLAKECKRRKLDEQSVAHFKKACELRKPEIKSGADREKFARWLEKDCGLFDEALAEYLAVYTEMKGAAASSAAEHFKLGSWCEKHSLYDEADAEYQEVLKLDPKYSMASRGIERLKQLRETVVNAPIFRTVKEEMAQGIGFYSGKITGEGAYGSDVSEAGIQGLRAMTSLCGMGLIANWEFDAVDKPDAAKTLPKELAKALEFVLGHPEEKKALRGPDVWGAIYGIEFLSMILKKDAVRSKKDAIRAKIEACIGALQRMQSPDGGWAYYNHNHNRPNSFLTAPAILALRAAEREGIAVSPDLIKRAAASVQSQRQGDGVFMYKGGARQSPEGSCGRAPLCELALLAAGVGSVQQVQFAVDSFFKYRHILEKIKGKKGTHIGSGATAPYYFLIGHWYAARAIKALDKSLQSAYIPKLRDLVLACQETDNSWWDTPLEKDCKIYGTAMGVLTLYHLATLGNDLGPPKRGAR
jgi:tetratricopeptide (TPR) repeat protein